jgi:homoserine O-succinyltransferase
MSLEIAAYSATIPPTLKNANRSDRRGAIVIALISNMPDAAREATERQCFTLLRAAAGHLAVRLRYAYLPQVARSCTGVERLPRIYWPIDELVREPVDAVIVTGAEPHAAQHLHIHQTGP